MKSKGCITLVIILLIFQSNLYCQSSDLYFDAIRISMIDTLDPTQPYWEKQKVNGQEKLGSGYYTRSNSTVPVWIFYNSDTLKFNLGFYDNGLLKTYSYLDVQNPFLTVYYFDNEGKCVRIRRFDDQDVHSELKIGGSIVYRYINHYFKRGTRSFPVFYRIPRKDRRVIKYITNHPFVLANKG